MDYPNEATASCEKHEPDHSIDVVLQYGQSVLTSDSPLAKSEHHAQIRSGTELASAESAASNSGSPDILENLESWKVHRGCNGNSGLRARSRRF
jgi:hypothetical protein